jgi:hypothetical protein
LTATARSTVYGEARPPLRTQDLIEIENAGRRCRSGRGWRRSEVVRPAEREPIVFCGGCRARFGDDPPRTQASSPIRTRSCYVWAARAGAPPPCGERNRPAPGSPTSGAAQAAWLILDGDGRPRGKRQQRQGARPPAGPGAPRRGPTRRQALVDRSAPERPCRSHGSASGADEQPSDRPGTGAGRLTSRQPIAGDRPARLSAVSGGEPWVNSRRLWPVDADGLGLA